MHFTWRIGKNYALKLCFFSIWPNVFKHLITPFSTTLEITHGKTDHSPAIFFDIVIMNLRVLEIHWYNVNHYDWED